MAAFPDRPEGGEWAGLILDHETHEIHEKKTENKEENKASDDQSSLAKIFGSLNRSS
jgi:hypothetical protein